MDKNAPPTNITNSDFKIGRLEKNGFLIQLYMAIENVYIIGIQVKVEKKLCTSNSPYIYKNKGQESPVLQQNMEVACGIWISFRESEMNLPLRKSICLIRVNTEKLIGNAKITSPLAIIVVLYLLKFSYMNKN